MKLIFLAHLAATLAMVGAIWIVQVVHYPLFDRVGAAGFATYANDHSALITLVVGPLMLIEAGTALLLVLETPPPIPVGVALVGLVLVGVAWASTLFLQVPQHAVLTNGFDAQAYRVLVDSNWLRTIAWTLRGGLVLWMAARLMA
jgi:hypothetical protein